MAYDLRHEPWIPWRRRSGIVEWGPPAMLVDGIEDDPVVSLAAPRPDFNGALQEFLIGLLTVALRPEDEDEWEEHWHRPPTRQTLQAAIDALPAAFYLDGDGPRFFQDLTAADFADVEPGRMEQLLIDAPGDQGLRLNKDLFVKRDRVRCTSYPTAAMALVTLQTYAPAGGAGYRTSLRGGGPLTTLIDPRRRDGRYEADLQPLWQKLWANAETAVQFGRRSTRDDADGRPEGVFPWLAATRTSKNDQGTTPEDTHPLQAYFGLPRRIRLETGGPGRCEVTGEEVPHTVVGFVARNYGVQYVGWRHPLTPYYRAKSGGELLPMHGQPGGVGWRDWLPLTLRTAQGTREPAQCVAAFSARAQRVGLRAARLHAFGYDMDNMKARGWVDADLPVIAADEPLQQVLAAVAQRLTEGAAIVASALLLAVRRALFDKPDDVPGDLSEVKTELWAATAAPFYSAVERIAARSGAAEEVDATVAEFAESLRREALKVFDRWCSEVGASPAGLRRLVAARFDLTMLLGGFSPLGEKLFGALGIPIPGGGKKSRAAQSRKRKEATT